MRAAIRYEAYLRGRYLLNKGTVEGFRDAIRIFEEAIGKDPADALAHDGLADAYAFLGRFHGMPHEEAFTKAKRKPMQLSRSIPIWPRLTRPSERFWRSFGIGKGQSGNWSGPSR